MSTKVPLKTQFFGCMCSILDTQSSIALFGKVGIYLATPKVLTSIEDAMNLDWAVGVNHEWSRGVPIRVSECSTEMTNE